MKKNQKNRYLRAQKSSFQTKLDLFVFESALTGRSEVDYSAFEAFNIRKDHVQLYTTQYWQKDHAEKVSDTAYTVNDLYLRMHAIKKDLGSELAEWEKSYAKQFPSVFPESAFVELINKQKCAYCGITHEKIEKLGRNEQLFKKSERGWSLEIDRKNSNYEYSPSNCVLACYWCNNAKTDEFTFEEFEVIGKAIKQIWQKRLNKIQNS